MERDHDGRGQRRLGTRPHPVHFAGAAGWVAFVGLVVTLLIRHNDLAATTNWAIVGGGLVAAVSGLVGPAMRWVRTWIEIDGAEARCTGGLLKPSTVCVNLERARAVAVERGVAGRWLGYGRLHVVDEVGTTHVFPPVGAAALRVALTARERRSRGRRDRRDA